VVHVGLEPVQDAQAREAGSTSDRKTVFFMAPIARTRPNALEAACRELSNPKIPNSLSGSLNEVLLDFIRSILSKKNPADRLKVVN
jgi:hypothetical protein